MSWQGIITPQDASRGIPLTFSSLFLRMVVFLKSLLTSSPKHWIQNPRKISENVLQKHTSPLRLCASRAEAGDMAEGKVKRTFRSFSLATEGKHCTWRFELYPSPSESPTVFDNDESFFEKWGTLTTVPSDWQLTDTTKIDEPIYTNFFFPLPNRKTKLSTHVDIHTGNPTGVYRGMFKLPQKWCGDDSEKENDVVLILHGAGSAVEVYLNDVSLGYCTDSMTEHEFCLPPAALHRDPTKKHFLTLKIYKYSSGSYMEDQDQWWFTGIHRDVELQLRPRPACLWDMSVNASFAAARVEISCEIYCDDAFAEALGSSDGTLVTRATLMESETNVLETLVLKAEILGKQTSNTTTMEKSFLDQHRTRAVCSGSMFVLPKERIQPWTAETPKLYVLVLELVHLPWAGTEEQEHVIQVEYIKVGFRDVGQNFAKFGQFEINGKRIVFRGVNRHEFSPHTGKVISEESMIADILQMKKHNFNAVRNSHYPNNYRWYELCDFYGLYVIDEANIETHGFVLGGAISLLQFDSRYKDSFLNRAHAMVLRARNHPCVVVWSLGNESGFGPNSLECKKLIKQLDANFSGRPVVYEGGIEKGVPLILGNGRSVESDFIFPMYHTADLIESYEAESKARCAPVVLCEYAHCMGNSGGNLHLYWDLFWRPEGVWQGGFMWDWVDQGLSSEFFPKTHNTTSFVARTSSLSSAVTGGHQNSTGSAVASPTRKDSQSKLTGTDLASTTRASLSNEPSTPSGTSVRSSLMAQQQRSRRGSSGASASMQGGGVQQLFHYTNFAHRRDEYCVSKERLFEISFTGRGWGYGGDFGDHSGNADAQFCCNGVVFPDRSAKPALMEAKYLMQPFVFTLESVENGKICVMVTPRYDLGLEDVSFEYQLQSAAGMLLNSKNNDTSGFFSPATMEDKGVALIGTFQLEHVDATTNARRLFVNLPVPDIDDDGDEKNDFDVENSTYFLRITAKADLAKLRFSAPTSQSRWIEQDHEFAHESFELLKKRNGFHRAAPLSPMKVLPLPLIRAPATSSVSLNVVEGTKQILIHALDYDARVDFKTGALTSFRGKDGIERLNGPSLLPCLFRAPLDNDLGGVDAQLKSSIVRALVSPTLLSYAFRWRNWLKLDRYDDPNYVWPHTSVSVGISSVLITRKDDLFEIFTVLAFHDGGVQTKVTVNLLGTSKYQGKLDSLPRVGTSLELAHQFSQITYAGRGPVENYPDRKAFSALGVYVQNADDFHVPYVFPSESGARSDVRWVVFEDATMANSESQTIPAGISLAYSCHDATDWPDASVPLQRSKKIFKRPVDSRGAVLSVSRFRISQIDKAKHQYDLCKDLADWHNASLKVVLDTAHMGVGGDVSWLPSTHNPFKVGMHDSNNNNESSSWTYQIDLNVLSASVGGGAPGTKLDADDLEKRKKQLERVLRG